MTAGGAGDALAGGADDALAGWAGDALVALAGGAGDAVVGLASWAGDALVGLVGTEAVLAGVDCSAWSPELAVVEGGACASPSF